MNNQETWKDIKGYKGFYQVSNLGNVRSLDRKIIRSGDKKGTYSIVMKGKILKPGLIGGKKGKDYCMVVLCKYKRKKVFYIHRLVLEAFNPYSKGKRFCNHKDGNTRNNHIDNLEWCTAGENLFHCYINDRRGRKEAVRKLNHRKVEKIRKLFPKLGALRLAEKFNIGRSTVYDVMSGKTWNLENQE